MTSVQACVFLCIVQLVVSAPRFVYTLLCDLLIPLVPSPGFSGAYLYLVYLCGFFYCWASWTILVPCLALLVLFVLGQLPSSHGLLGSICLFLWSVSSVFVGLCFVSFRKTALPGSLFWAVLFSVCLSLLSTVQLVAPCIRLCLYLPCYVVPAYAHTLLRHG